MEPAIRLELMTPALRGRVYIIYLGKYILIQFYILPHKLGYLYFAQVNIRFIFHPYFTPRHVEEG